LEIEPLLVRMARNATEPLGERLRVAVLAAGANLGAAGDRIPRCVGPLDGRMLSHRAPPARLYASQSGGAEALMNVRSRMAGNKASSSAAVSRCTWLIASASAHTFSNHACFSIGGMGTGMRRNASLFRLRFRSAL